MVKAFVDQTGACLCKKKKEKRKKKKKGKKILYKVPKCCVSDRTSFLIMLK